MKFTHRIDLDLDGVITTNDATIFNSQLHRGPPAYWAIGDLDYDRVFTTNDATIFNSFYNESLASVPEPGAVFLLELGGSRVGPPPPADRLSERGGTRSTERPPKGGSASRFHGGFTAIRGCPDAYRGRGWGLRGFAADDSLRGREGLKRPPRACHVATMPISSGVATWSGVQKLRAAGPRPIPREPGRRLRA